MRLSSLLAAFAVSLPRAVQAQGEAPATRAALEFEAAAARAPKVVAPADAFATQPECAVADLVHIQAEKLWRVVESLEPCARALSVRYDLPVTVGAGAIGVTAAEPGFVLGVVFRLGWDDGALSPARREIQEALAKRESGLQGHRARLGLPSDRGVFASSSLQASVERCAPPPNVRQVPPRTAADFARRYAECLRAERHLQVRTVRPAPGSSSRVEVYSKAGPGAVRGMSGLVVVMGVGDLVGFEIEANEDPVIRPNAPTPP